jgi:hypothetical protein
VAGRPRERPRFNLAVDGGTNNAHGTLKISHVYPGHTPAFDANARCREPSLGTIG